MGAGLAAAGLALAFGSAGACTGAGGGPVSARERLQRIRVDDAALRAIGYRRDWTGFPVLVRGERIRFVVPADDLVVVLESGGTVTAIEASNGSQRWANPIGRRLTTFVGVSVFAGQVHVSTESEVLVLDAATGHLVGRHPLDKLAATRPVIAGGLGIYGTWAGELMAHDMRSGLFVWGNAIWGDRPPGAIDQPPVLIGDIVGAVSHSGEIFFAEAASGSERGRNRAFARSTSAPVTDGASMFVASLDQSLYSFDPAGGAQRWRHRTASPLSAQPAIVSGVLTCEIPGEGLVGFDPASGRVLWRAPQVRGTAVGERTGRMLVWDAPGAWLVDPARGDVEAAVRLDGITRLISDGKPDSFLYAVTDRGALMRLAPTR
jgi:outer membrane protein assembly factor BamB